jgi:hypothetical protein
MGILNAHWSKWIYPSLLTVIFVMGETGPSSPKDTFFGLTALPLGV